MSSYHRFFSFLLARVWAVQPEQADILLDVYRSRGLGLTVDLDALTPNHGGDAYALDAKIPGQTANAIARRPGTVGVLPIRGTIGHRMGGLDESSGVTSTERAGRSLATLFAEPKVKAIVLDVDSRGGTVDGVTELAAQIRVTREVKPVIAQVNATAASAAYWLASQASEVAVTPSGSVGSIGVLAVHEDRSAQLAQEGRVFTIVRSVPEKADANPIEPLSEEALGAIQADVDAFHRMFVSDVAAGRGVSADTVNADYGRGRMLLAADALRAGMVDRIATFDETLSRLGVPTGVPSAQRRAHAARQIRQAKLRRHRGVTA